ncbi:hypothetical protein BJ165DRAFT_930445 [Panaeolus papilionaceus]|nr:hypothetical protein BJ165DRAFT_930445 [Panaeolus papilionaceus]
MTKNQIFTEAYANYHNLELARLQDLATGPSRVIVKLRSRGGTTEPDNQSAPLKFVNKRIISIGSGTVDEQRAFSRLCLIPGGRFLFAYSHPELRLYDLDTGLQPQKGVNEILCIPCNDDWMFLSAPSSDGKEIRLVVAQDGYSHHFAEVSVMRFIVDDADCAPSLINKTTRLEVSHPSDPDYFTLVHDLFIYTYIPRGPATGTCIVNVWNFIEDTFASWSIPNHNYVEFYYDSGYVVMIEKHFLRGWKMPPLRPRDGQNAIPIQDIPESFRTPLNNDTPKTRLLPQPQCKRPYDWYNSFHPLEVFTFRGQNSDSHTWTTHTIRQTSAEVSTSTSALQPQDKIVVTHSVLSQFPRRITPSISRYITDNPFFICNDYAVRLFAYNQRPFAVLIPLLFVDEDPTDRELSPVVELQLLEDLPMRPSLHSRVHFTFDPFSGRLVYISECHDTIAVLDYLKHPGIISEVHASQMSVLDLGLVEDASASVVNFRVKPCCV